MSSEIIIIFLMVYILSVGLPPSPPSQAPTSGILPPISAGGAAQRPIGVDINNNGHKMSSAKIAVIAIASIMGVAISLGVIWLLILRRTSWAPPTAIENVPVLTTKRCGRSGT